MPNRASIEAIADWLKSRDDFALFGHVSPDGDAAGSCIATALMLQKARKTRFRRAAGRSAEDVFGL